MLSGFLTVAGLTLLAKSMSFFKDAAVAGRYGTSESLDAFLLAFSLLSTLASMLGCGMPEAFLPAFSGVTHDRSLQQAHRLGVQMALFNATCLIALGCIMYVCAPYIIGFAARGFNVQNKALAVQSLRGLLPFFLCFGLTFHLSSWLRAQKKFFIASISPVVLPFIIIVCLLATGKQASIQTLVLGTNLGAIISLSCLVIAVFTQLPRSISWFRNCLQGWDPSSLIVVKNTLPYLLAATIMGSSTVVDQTMASWLEPGSVAVLNYSEKICGIILALTAIAASDALFPFFAETVARRQWSEVRRQLLQVTGGMLVIALPLLAVLCVFAPQIVSLLFQRGEFGADDTARVAVVLRCAALQVPFYIMGILASRVAVSLQATKFMLFASIISMVLNVVCNAWFMHYLGVAGIALSTAMVHLVSAATFYIYIFRNIAQRTAAQQEVAP